VVRQLRIWSTVLLGVAIGQAGFGSALGASLIARQKSELMESIHQGNAWLLVLVTVVCAGIGVRYRQQGGPSWPLVFAGCLLGAEVLQIALGHLRVVALHLFFGVLLLCAVTTLCSYAWRHRPVRANRGDPAREAS
jgi:uncharacterized membrane protein YdjX (TVP38/TMEM64 family)